MTVGVSWCGPADLTPPWQSIFFPPIFFESELAAPHCAEFAAIVATFPCHKQRVVTPLYIVSFRSSSHKCKIVPDVAFTHFLSSTGDTRCERSFSVLQQCTPSRSPFPVFVRNEPLAPIVLSVRRVQTAFATKPEIAPSSRVFPLWLQERQIPASASFSLHSVCWFVFVVFACVAHALGQASDDGVDWPR